MNPNGGLLARFPGLSMPSPGLTFYGATPADTPYQTAIYSIEYDGFADFPQYPINVLADLNAVAGIIFVHSLYPNLDPTTLPASDIVQLPVEPTYTGNTTYYMVLTHNLPLSDPLRAVPVVGNPLADLLQPDLTTLVNLGCGDPNYGYSTGPANVATPFGLFPHVPPGVIASDLVTGAQQGINAAVTSIPSYDINLVLAGIAQAVSGDPVGLINAVGYPIAATTGLITVLGGVESLVLLLAAAQIIQAWTGLVP